MHNELAKDLNSKEQLIVDKWTLKNCRYASAYKRFCERKTYYVLMVSISLELMIKQEIDI